MSQYLHYVNDVLGGLKTLKNLPKLSVYDTGFGISVCPYTDDYWIDTLWVVQNRIVKIGLPKSEGAAWDKDWASGLKLVNEFVKNHNSSIKTTTAE